MATKETIYNLNKDLVPDLVPFHNLDPKSSKEEKQNRSRGHSRERSAEEQRQPKPGCSYCGEPGHDADVCFINGRNR